MNSALEAPPTRILVVDDHSLVREGLTILLDRDDGVTIVGTAGTGEEAILAAHTLRPDVIIMDLVLPALSGIEATQRIVSQLPQIRIIALSACRTAEHVYRALRAGAHGYVLKTADGSELLTAIKAVVSGEQYVSPALTSLFEGGVPGAVIPESPFESLSERERDVLRHIVAGETSSDIANQLSLSRKTVDTYRGRIMVKLGVRSRAELIRLTLEYELPSA